MVTQTLRLHTNILVLPYRNPFLTAKSIASLDVVSGGRVIMGVAAGYLEGEYHALGADFADRNAVLDESLRAMKNAWTGESVELAGRGYHVAGNTARPRPLQQPHPPIWIGGNSKRAIQRAVLQAQGWSPFPLPAKFAGRTRTAAIESARDLGEKIRYLNEYAQSVGRSDPIEVNFVPFGHGMNSHKALDPAAFREQVEELGSVGVTWLSLGLPGESLDEYLESVARFGEDVIA
jgi:probable F420-dependent oxidoreductase